VSDSASVREAVRKLSAAGLTVDVDGDFILCEDPGLDFERSHDGVRGVSRWVAETLSEYEEICAELFEVSEEEPMIEQQIKEELEDLEKPTPPEKEHRIDQLALAYELNSPKEIWQAGQNDDQDMGGIPNPVAYITEKKQAVAIVVLVQGQRFMAPDGWKIKERRTDRALYYGSILMDHKARNERLGSQFSLVRDL